MTKNEHIRYISLNPPQETVFLKSRKWSYLLLGIGIFHLLTFISLAVLAFLSYEKEVKYFQLGIQSVLGINFIVQGGVALRQDRKLFVSFDDTQIRFKDGYKKKVVVLQNEDVERVDLSTFHAYFHLKDQRRVKLEWPTADYDQIQELKSQLKKFQALQTI